MDEKDKEEFEVSELYKRAFNDAELIITQFPHLISKMEAPEGESSEYTKGFQDRVKQYEIEKDAVKNFSYDQLRDKYSKDLDDDKKDHSKGMEKD